MSTRIVGRCSLCGGDVVVPVIWSGIHPPVPTCVQCHATAARPELPVVPMTPPPKRGLTDGEAVAIAGLAVALVALAKPRRRRRVARESCWDGMVRTVDGWLGGVG